MAHLHPVYDTDCHFLINPNSRDITYDGTDPLVLIQNDHNSEHYTFEIPRYVDGHDMSECNSVQVHYINIDAGTGARVLGLYEVKDLQLAVDDEEVVICSWAISQNATQLVGSLIFALRFACMTGSTLDYVWNTMVYSGVTVSSGIYNGEEAVEDYKDALLIWYDELVETLEESINKIASVGGIIVSETEPQEESVSVWIDNSPKPQGEIALLDSTDITRELSDDEDKVPSVALLKRTAEQGGSGNGGANVWRCTTANSTHDVGNPWCPFDDIADFDENKAKVGDIIIDAEGTVLEIVEIQLSVKQCWSKKIGCGSAEINVPFTYWYCDTAFEDNNVENVSITLLNSEITNDESRLPRQGEFVIDKGDNWYFIYEVDVYNNEISLRRLSPVGELSTRINTLENSQKKQTTRIANLEESLGDIDTALDAILAIQESLIKTITFNIISPSTDKDYTAWRGATWGQWVNSEYNTDGFYIDTDDVVCFEDGSRVTDDEPARNYQYSSMSIVDAGTYMSD